MHDSNKHSRIHFLIIIVSISIACGSIFGFIGGLLGGRALKGVAQLDQLIPYNPLSSSAALEQPVSKGVIRLEEESATIDVVKKASPAVVSIIVTKDIEKVYRRSGSNPLPFEDFFEFGFPFDFKFAPGEGGQDGAPRGKQQVGGGSGFIITADGLILTNRHVVSDEDAEYTVITNDGKEYAAKILAKDPVNDLAIIKIDGRRLPALALGDSQSIQIGQTVIAIGNTLGEYRNTVTRGVISGVNRVVQASDGLGDAEVIQEAIQTDAAINPGNSGGPLLNLAGQVIGINTAVNRAGQSIGFAIPVNIAKRSVESVKKYGRIIRPWLGVRYTLVDEMLKKNNNLSVEYGALIIGNPARKELGVVAGSPAERAGLSDGDIILEVNGQKIDRSRALANAIAQYAPGDTITLRVLSKGKERSLSVKLEEFKELK